MSKRVQTVPLSHCFSDSEKSNRKQTMDDNRTHSSNSIEEQLNIIRAELKSYDETIDDSFDITLANPDGLVILVESTSTVEDPEHSDPGTTPISATATWAALGKNDRVAKNTTLSNGSSYFESAASSITVSFEGKALSGNKGSLFNFKLEATSNGTVVDKYTVYYAPINEDGTGYYVTTDEYATISLTITGISESDNMSSAS